MTFRIAGLVGVLVLLIVSVLPVSAQAAIFIGESGSLSNGRYTATVDVGFTCEHPDAYMYFINVRIVQPSGRSWAEGVYHEQGACVAGEDVYRSLPVDTMAAAFKPGPATLTVDLERGFTTDDGGYDSDRSQASTSVHLQGGDGGSLTPAQAVIVIGDQGTLSNGRQTATVDIGFTCDHPNAYNYNLTVRIVQPSGQNLAEGVGYGNNHCATGEAVSHSVSVDTMTTAFKPGPATVIVDLTRTHCCDDFVETHASATVKFKGN